MLKEDFAACFTRIGPYKRDESMLVLLKMLDAERRRIKLDAFMMREFGAANMAKMRINKNYRDKQWRVY